MNALELNLAVSVPKGVVFLPFSPEHLDTLELRQPDFSNATEDELKAHIVWQASSADAVTVKLNGKTLGVWGCNLIWQGLEEAWFVVDEACRQ